MGRREGIKNTKRVGVGKSVCDKKVGNPSAKTPKHDYTHK
jgi:hypothetical protein